jgi:hypothetical protein
MTAYNSYRLFHVHFIDLIGETVLTLDHCAARLQGFLSFGNVTHQLQSVVFAMLTGASGHNLAGFAMQVLIFLQLVMASPLLLIGLSDIFINFFETLYLILLW